MRDKGLDPWLDHEGYIHIAYRPKEAYFDYLKANKRYALQEFTVEAAIGVELQNFSDNIV